MAKPSKKPAPAEAPKHWIQIQTMRALLLAAETFREAHREILVGHDLSMSDLDVIVTLGNTKGLRMKDIAEKMFSSSSTSNITRLCIGLEKRGLLQRRRSPESDREVIASLTEAGERMFEIVFPAATEFVRGYANERLTESELLTLRALLAKLTVPLS